MSTLAERLHSVALHLMRAVRKADDSRGISRARLSALSVVVFSPGITPAELAAAEGVTRPTITTIVQGLESMGLVTRKAAAAGEDRRYARIYPTAAGKRELFEAREARLKILERILRDLSREQQRALLDAVEILEPRVAG